MNSNDMNPQDLVYEALLEDFLSGGYCPFDEMNCSTCEYAKQGVCVFPYKANEVVPACG